MCLLIRSAEFELVQPRLQFIESQEHPTVLSKQLPAEPKAQYDNDVSQG
jgi:hypothetical protein